MTAFVISDLAIAVFFFLIFRVFTWFLAFFGLTADWRTASYKDVFARLNRGKIVGWNYTINYNKYYCPFA